MAKIKDHLIKQSENFDDSDFDYEQYKLDEAERQSERLENDYQAQLDQMACV